MILNKIISTILILLLIFSTASCSRKISKYFPNRPDTDFQIDPHASPDFKQGWEDGCEVGMAGGSNTFYKMFYQNNKADGYKMTGSSDYKAGWGAAFWYCFRYSYVKAKSSVWSSTFSGYQ